MKCDKCGSLNIVAKIVIQGEKNSEELNLCPLCFQKFVKDHPEIQNGSGAKSFNNFLLGTLNLINPDISSGKGNGTASGIKQCSNCGQSSRNLMKHHLTGCSTCYKEFKDEIDQILLDNIGTNTVLYEKPPATKKEKVKKLEKSLQKAVDTENYEKAAQMRDELKKIRKNR